MGAQFGSTSRSKIKTSTAVQAAKKAMGNARPERPPPVLRRLTQPLKPETHADKFPMPSATPGCAAVEATSAVCFSFDWTRLDSMVGKKAVKGVSRSANS